jgi:hypothetical protein
MISNMIYLTFSLRFGVFIIVMKELSNKEHKKASK